MVSPSSGAPQILQIAWSDLAKSDGSSLLQWIEVVSTTTMQIEQPCQHLFFAIAASQNKVVTFDDMTNAFQQSPPPTEQCYLEIDDAYASWHFKHFGKDVDRTSYVVLPGHPEQEHYGRRWQTPNLKIPKLDSRQQPMNGISIVEMYMER
jgi:hypothetical protein